LLRENRGQGGCVRRVLLEVPADSTLDPVVRSETQDRKACELEDAGADDNVENNNADSGRDRWIVQEIVAM